MTGAHDEAGTQQLLHAPYLILDLLRSPVDKQILCVNSPQECDPALELTGKVRGFHIVCPCLERVKTIHSCINQPLNDTVDGST